MGGGNKGGVRVFVCKPYYPDTTNIVWEHETRRRRAPEDSESVFDIKKEKKQRRVGETEVNRDEGRKDPWRRGEKGAPKEPDSSSFSVSLQATHNRRSEREGTRVAMARRQNTPLFTHTGGR